MPAIFRHRATSRQSPLANSGHARRLRVETLEDRRLLAVLTVQNNLDDTLANLAGDGELSLREAIAVANNPGTVIDGFVSNDVADEILFDATAFTGGDANLIRLHGVELEITETLTIDASSVGGVTITGDANDDDVTDENHITDVDASITNDFTSLNDNPRVLNFVPAGGDLTLNSFTITGGGSRGIVTSGAGIRFDSDGSLILNGSSVSGNRTFSTFTYGGGIYTSAGSVSLTDSIVSGNRAEGNITSGGGIFAEFGSVTLTRSEVSSNYSVFDGGGIFTNSGAITLMDSEVSDNRTKNISVSSGGGLATSSGAVTLTRSDIKDNFTGGDGGGIFTDSGPITVTESTVVENESVGNGGGIAASSGSVFLNMSTISGNRADHGGAISGGSTTTISLSTIRDNQARDDGGGIFITGGAANINDSTIVGNTAINNGGGLAASGSVTITNTTFSRNSAGIGGAIVDSIFGGPLLQIISSTITGNAATVGGGIYSSGQTTLLNSIVANSPYGGDLIGNGSFSGSYNLIGDGQYLSSFANSVFGDPLLGPLTDNGGPTLTHALLPGSPALDAGDPSIAFDLNQFDQRGAPFLRVADGNLPADIAIDIGAYEAQTIASADFDADGDVDGSDFLAWQRGLGTELAVRADGNSDDDTDVDASDLAAWTVTYGDGVASGQSAVASEGLAVDAAVAALFDASSGVADDEVALVWPQVVEFVREPLAAALPGEVAVGDASARDGVADDSANSGRDAERTAQVGIESDPLGIVLG